MQICKKRLPFKNSIFLTPRVGDKLQKRKTLGSKQRSAENCAWLRRQNWNKKNMKKQELILSHKKMTIFLRYGNFKPVRSNNNFMYFWINFCRHLFWEKISSGSLQTHWFDPHLKNAVNSSLILERSLIWRDTMSGLGVGKLFGFGFYADKSKKLTIFRWVIKLKKLPQND